MTIPGFTAEVALRAVRGRYVAQRPVASSTLVQPAQISAITRSPFNLCQICPECCHLPAVNVSWLACGTGSGYVVVTGSNFSVNSGVHGQYTDCSGAFPVRLFANTDDKGSFTTWQRCDCGGSTTVTATDSSGNTAQMSTAMPC
jgi:hypothetical protein